MRQLAPFSEIQRSEPTVSGVKCYEPVLIKWAVGGIEVTQISPRRTHSNRHINGGAGIQIPQFLARPARQ